MFFEKKIQYVLLIKVIFWSRGRQLCQYQLKASLPKSGRNWVLLEKSRKTFHLKPLPWKPGNLECMFSKTCRIFLAQSSKQKEILKDFLFLNFEQNIPLEKCDAIMTKPAKMFLSKSEKKFSSQKSFRAQSFPPNTMNAALTKQFENHSLNARWKFRKISKTHLRSKFCPGGLECIFGNTNRKPLIQNRKNVQSVSEKSFQFKCFPGSCW